MKGNYTYEYPRASLTADVVVFTADKSEVLLIKRKNEPYKGTWAFPGGFMDMNETLEQCAYRELKEETNITVDVLYEIGVFSAVDRDPRGRTVTAAYYTFVEDKDKLNAKALDDAAEIEWFRIDNIPTLAFDHKDILGKALRLINYVTTNNI